MKRSAQDAEMSVDDEGSDDQAVKKQCVDEANDATKQCTRCLKTMLLTMFYVQSDKKAGYSSRCRDCIQYVRKHPELKKAKRKMTDEAAECTNCKEMLPLTQYYQANSKKGGIGHTCKTCQRKNRKLKGPKPKTVLVVKKKSIVTDPVVIKLKDPKKDSKKSSQSIKTTLKQRVKGVIGHDIKAGRITSDQKYSNGDTADMVTYDWARKQPFVCYISKRKVFADTGVECQLSLDRIDDSEPHTKSNTAICALELNVQAKWTAEKFKHAMEHNDEPIDTSDATMFDLPKRTKFTRTEHIFEYHGDNMKCVKCGHWYTEDKYLKKKSLGCLECRRITQAKMEYCLRGSFSKLLASCRQSAKRYERKECDLTFEDFVHMYTVQKGLCAVSGLQLSVHKGSWRMSIERINPRSKYTRSNCCLVCMEFNAHDRTVQMEEGQSSGVAWTREKYLRWRADYHLASQVK